MAKQPDRSLERRAIHLHVAAPESGFAAVFGELTFPTDSMLFYLSTNVTIIGAQTRGEIRIANCRPVAFTNY